MFVFGDDLVILSPELSGFKWAKEKLNTMFKLKDLAELTYYLQLSFKQIGNTMVPSQSAHCSCVLKLFIMDASKSSSTAVVKNTKELFKETVSSEAEPKRENGSFTLP